MQKSLSSQPVAVHGRFLHAWSVYLLLAVLVGWLYTAAYSSAATADKPQRIVSVNLCTDQLLMMLADPEQIASVSHLSLEPNSSFMAKEASGFTINHTRPEEILSFKPDLILAGEFSSRSLLSLLEKLGHRVERIPITSNIEMIRSNIRTIARLVGYAERGEKLIQQMDMRIDSVRARKPEVEPKAAFYQPNGYTSGGDTLQHSALIAAGWRNLPAETGMKGYGDVPLEQLLLMQPDQLFTSAYAPGTDSLAQRELRHPVLKQLTRGRPIINIGYRYWICGGPMIADAIEQLHREIPK